MRGFVAEGLALEQGQEGGPWAAAGEALLERLEPDPEGDGGKYGQRTEGESVDQNLTTRHRDSRESRKQFQGRQWLKLFCREDFYLLVCLSL